MSFSYKVEKNSLLSRIGNNHILFESLWQNGLMNEIRRHPNLVPPEDGKTPPSLLVPFYDGEKKGAFGYRAGMSCISQVDDTTLQLKYVDCFPACIVIALISLWYSAYKKNHIVKCTLLIPTNENDEAFQRFLNKVCSYIPFVSVEVKKSGTSTKFTLPRRYANGAIFVAKQLKQIDLGRFYLIGDVAHGDFSTKDCLTLTDGEYKVVHDFCPAISVSHIINGVEKPADTIKRGDGLSAIFTAFWFPANTAFDGLLLIKEEDPPPFMPQAMPREVNLVPEKKSFFQRLFSKK